MKKKSFATWSISKCVYVRARGEEKTITDEDIANDESFLIW